MEKIDISQKDFNSLLREFLRAYYDYDGYSSESIEAALKEKIFNIKKEFDENSWNDCDVEVPSEYWGCDLLIRLKNTIKKENGYTVRGSDYKVGYYSSLNNKFLDSDGSSIVTPDEYYKYEYKLIK